MKSPFEIIKTVRITEKGTVLAEKNQYVFKVNLTATKQEIRHAVESLFKKKVERVNTLRVYTKVKRNKFGLGRRAAWKKAIVTLKEGEKLDLV